MKHLWAYENRKGWASARFCRRCGEDCPPSESNIDADDCPGWPEPPKEIHIGRFRYVRQ